MSMTNSTNRVEIITSVQRRRRWTAPEKARMVEENRRLGHGSPTITLKVYGHLIHGTDDRAAQIMEPPQPLDLKRLN